MCIEGPCFDELTVMTDGTWVLKTEKGDKAGRLSSKEREAVAAATRVTKIGNAPAGSGYCDADADGLELTYGWRTNNQEQSRSSCEVDLPPDDPLIIVLDRLSGQLSS